MSKEFVFFYKDENQERRPIIYGPSEDYKSLVDKKFIDKIEIDFPKAKDNLFVVTEGIEYRLR